MNQCHFIYFVVQIIPTLAIGSFCCWILKTIARSLLLLFLSTSSLSDATSCYRLILYIFCSSPGISYFPKEIWFLLLADGIGNQNLGASMLTWMSVLLGTSLANRAEEYMCVYQPLYIHISINICVYVKLKMSSH